ncbi:biotin operon repressor biotin--[acetyl-CoA-carboxylase] synthetase [Liquorilactobacillus mali KCTC 3596 = DSM 20444]|uniref:Bifunctional ligase/repressor BirA n=2 Tax=Liquorilactobacillus mali TaxID=1618 RepID=A0A0R2ED33_9LACO|nr:biotin operon repressor biotin--[acetyl-CoA-carboxylase] synthetase [Liquorilactobacillus mali KCTC 3596 = DSM 20444]
MAHFMNNTQKVLELLSNSTNYLSGEKIASEVGISRTAVWKIVKNLQDLGYPIKSKMHSGYYYKDNNKLNEFIIKKNLPTDLKNIAFELHDSLNSTNIRAKEISASQVDSQPLIIISDQQTGGYGRYGRSFSSPKTTGIYMSILLKTQSKELNPGLLTTATALAVARTIEKNLGVATQIKWVNDVLVNQKKVVGILTEAVSDIESGSINQVIIGIGINYLSDISLFPPEIQERVGTLREYVEQSHLSRNYFIAQLLGEFFALYSDYQSGDFIDEYKEKSYLIGKKVTIIQGEQRVSGIVADIDKKGRLVLQDGTILYSGEVTKVRLV